MKPLIGITCGARQNKEGISFYGILPAYTKSVAAAGGLPVLITPTSDVQLLREIYERMDGVLLAGGGDVDPLIYGMTDDGLVHAVDADRDAAEIAIARWAAAEDKPLLGICRGCQVANVALGGTLYRDIEKEYPGYNGLDHDQWGKAPRHHLAHPVTVEAGTKLAAAIGTQQVQVNTLHHQALRDVAPQLSVSASAIDGLIEGVEIPDARFFVGVQWHPEELAEYNEPMRRLFQTFIESARR
jgi:putative glutamine amidotransferase